MVTETQETIEPREAPDMMFIVDDVDRVRRYLGVVELACSSIIDIELRREGGLQELVGDLREDLRKIAADLRVHMRAK